MAQSNTIAASAAPSQPKSKSALLLVGIAVLLLAGGSGATWLFIVHKKQAQPAAEKTEKTEKKDPEYTAHLDSFTVNLADQEESHFLRVTMDLGLAHAPKGEPGKEGAENSGFPTAQTRDTILTVLTACKANELLTSEGKTALKQRLVAALQQKVPDIDARDVYFTEFLVQR